MSAQSTTMQWSASPLRAISPPSYPRSATVTIPRRRASPKAATTFLEPPLVENAIATSRGPATSDDLTHEDQLEADVVADRRDRRGFARERDRRNRRQRTRLDAVEDEIGRVGRRSAVAECEDATAAREPLADRPRGPRDSAGLACRDLFAQRDPVACLRDDRARDVGDDARGVLSLDAEIGVQETRRADVVTHRIVLEEYVHALVQRVAEDLEDLLVHVHVVGRGSEAVVGLRPRQRERQRPFAPRGGERGRQLRIAGGRPERDRDVVGAGEHIGCTGRRAQV